MIKFWCSVSNELTSDHFALLCSLDLRFPDPPSIKSSFRNIKCIDRHQLASGINVKLASIVNPTADTFHHCLPALLDKHSPNNSKLVQVRKHSPWYSNISDMLNDVKMKRRKAKKALANIWTDCAQRDLCGLRNDRY